MEKRKPGPAWVVFGLSLTLMALGPTGLWAKLAAKLPLSSLAMSLGIASLGLLPLGLAALALERDRPAPAIRSWSAPWLLSALAYSSVQLSGGLSSPLFGIYLLLGLYLARHTEWFIALGVIALLSLLEALPLVLTPSDHSASPWPVALVLFWPMVGVLAGWLTKNANMNSKGFKESVATNPVGTIATAVTPVWPIAIPEKDTLSTLNAETVLERDLQASLDLAMNSHPQWNALALWWGDAQEMRLRGLRLRRGIGAEIGTELIKGEGLLGLALREPRPLVVEPVAPSAAQTLPYYLEPGPARMLRALPLANEGRLVGLLVCDKDEEVPFGTDESAALESLVRILIAHSQRAFYLQSLHLAGARTNKLYEATRTLASSLDRDDLLHRFGALLSSVVPQDSWALALYEQEGGALVRLASVGYGSSAGASLALEQNTALMGILQQADAAVVFNGEATAIPAALNDGLAKPAQHFLLVPLRLSGRLAGVLKLDRRLAPFEEDERESALIFGNQAATTLENARLYSMHQKMATTDGLTGLYNHRYFQERLALELVQAARLGKPLSLALTDIDFFKKFNDTFGHQEGDVVLRKVAQLLKDHSRPGKDIVCRYGGEEFVIIMPDCDIVEARQVMDALRAYCGTNLVGGTGPEARAITMSIGLCSYPAGAKEQREIIHTADEALYKAKKSGRDQVCSFKDLP